MLFVNKKGPTLNQHFLDVLYLLDCNNSSLFVSWVHSIYKYTYKEIDLHFIHSILLFPAYKIKYVWVQFIKSFVCAFKSFNLSFNSQ